MKNKLKILACMFTCLASSAHASDSKKMAEEAQAKHVSSTFNPLSLNGTLAYSTMGAVRISLTDKAKDLNPSHVNESERKHINTTTFAMTIDQNKQSGSEAFLALFPDGFPGVVADLVAEYHFPFEIGQKMYAEQEAELLNRTKAHKGEIQLMLSVGSFQAFARLPKSVAYYYELPNDHRVTLKNSKKGWLVSSESPKNSYEEDFVTKNSFMTNLLRDMEGQICFNNRVMLAKIDNSGVKVVEVTSTNSINDLAHESLSNVSDIQFCSAFSTNKTLPVIAKGRSGFYELELKYELESKQDQSCFSYPRGQEPISMERVLEIPGHRFEPLDLPAVPKICVYKGAGKASHTFKLSDSDDDSLLYPIPLFVEDKAGNSYFIYASEKGYGWQKDTREYMLYNFQVFQAQWK